MAEQIKLKDIRRDGGTQSRVGIDENTVRDYADALRDGADFPPISVYYDGTDYWLADGFHRFQAHQRTGADTIAANVKQGTRRDAILESVGANTSHGLRPSRADKRRAVEKLLTDDEWGQWSDREIGRRCGVSHPTVAKVRADLVEAGKITSGDTRTYQQNGEVRTMNTEKIGDQKPEPDAWIRDLQPGDVVLHTTHSTTRPVFVVRVDDRKVIDYALHFGERYNDTWSHFSPRDGTESYIRGVGSVAWFDGEVKHGIARTYNDDLHVYSADTTNGLPERRLDVDRSQIITTSAEIANPKNPGLFSLVLDRIGVPLLARPVWHKRFGFEMPADETQNEESLQVGDLVNLPAQKQKAVVTDVDSMVTVITADGSTSQHRHTSVVTREKFSDLKKLRSDLRVTAHWREDQINRAIAKVADLLGIETPKRGTTRAGVLEVGLSVSLADGTQVTISDLDLDGDQVQRVRVTKPNPNHPETNITTWMDVETFVDKWTFTPREQQENPEYKPGDIVKTSTGHYGVVITAGRHIQVKTINGSRDKKKEHLTLYRGFINRNQLYDTLEKLGFHLIFRLQVEKDLGFTHDGYPEEQHPGDSEPTDNTYPAHSPARKGYFDTPPLRYVGAKWMLADWILSFFPAHEVYCEPFAGSGAVFFRKYPSPLEVLNDIDGDVVNFFRVLRDNRDELLRKIKLTPWSEEELRLSYETCEDPVERARRFYVSLWQSFGSTRIHKSSWRYQYNANQRTPVTKTWKRIDGLLDAADRLMDAQISSRPAIDCIAKFDSEKTLLYVDPPYVLSSRSGYGRKRYKHEMTDKDHEDLLWTLRYWCESKIIVSGYNHELYNDMLAGWRRLEKTTTTNGNSTSTEYLWLSPNVDDIDSLPLFAAGD